MLLSEVQRTESGGVINMGRTLAIKKGQTREKAAGFQEMGTFRCDTLANQNQPDLRMESTGKNPGPEMLKRLIFWPLPAVATFGLAPAFRSKSPPHRSPMHPATIPAHSVNCSYTRTSIVGDQNPHRFPS
jgi:hypothetical protein